MARFKTCDELERLAKTVNSCQALVLDRARSDEMYEPLLEEVVGAQDLVKFTRGNRGCIAKSW